MKWKEKFKKNEEATGASGPPGEERPRSCNHSLNKV